MLPKSGVYLEPGRTHGEGTLRSQDWRLNGLTFNALVARDCGARWCAWWPDTKTHWGAREEVIAWLDAKVLETRAALLPQDARERVARALFEAEWRDVNREDWPEFAIADFTHEVDAVLAALGLSGGGK